MSLRLGILASVNDFHANKFDGRVYINWDTGVAQVSFWDLSEGPVEDTLYVVGDMPLVMRVEVDVSEVDDVRDRCTGLWIGQSARFAGARETVDAMRRLLTDDVMGTDWLGFIYLSVQTYESRQGNNNLPALVVSQAQLEAVHPLVRPLLEQIDQRAVLPVEHGLILWSVET